MSQLFRQALAAAVTVVAASSVMAAPRAFAQPAAPSSPSSKTAQADALFEQGMKLMEASKFAEACRAFSQSQEIDPNVSTVMNLANCREKNLQLASAHRLFTEAAEELAAAPDADSANLRKVCLDRVAALGPRLSRLTLRVTAAAASLELVRDGVIVPPGQWNQAVPLDGGTYLLTAKAPGRAEWSAHVEVAAERDQKTIEVPELEPLVSRETRLEVRASPAPSARRSRALPIGLGLGALALGGGAIALDLNAQSLNDEAQDPSSGPYAERDEQWKSAKTRRFVAQGMAAAAIGAAGLAVYFYVRGGGRDESPKTARAPRLSPLLAPSPEGGVTGVQLDGRW